MSGSNALRPEPGPLARARATGRGKRRRPALTPAAAVVVVTGIVAAIASAGFSAGLHPIERRAHWSLREALAAKRLPPAVVRRLGSSSPEATVIFREWYSDLVGKKPLTSEGASISTTIVLMDLKTPDHLRFRWETTSDFQDGTVQNALTLWWSPGAKDVFKVRYALPMYGTDMASHVEGGMEAMAKGRLPENDEILLTFEHGGREWTTTADRWQKGLLSAVDIKLLRESLNEDTRKRLLLVHAVARGVPLLNEACDEITAPLLGYYGQDACALPDHPLLLEPAERPDCDFDASFGEPCTEQELLDSQVRKQPQLAPRPGPQADGQR